MAPVLYGPSLPGCGVSEGSRTSLRKVSSPGQGWQAQPKGERDEDIRKSGSRVPKCVLVFPTLKMLVDKDRKFPAS